MLELIKFVTKRGGNWQLAMELVASFIKGKPPANTDASKAESYHLAYRDKCSQQSLARAMQAIYERQRELTHHSARHHHVPASLSREETFKFVMKSYLHKQALQFAYYGIGNCSHRAAYSGIHLAQALKGTDVKVAVLSFPARDQYIVQLQHQGHKFIYDPLTNPEVLFKPEYYKEHILQKCFAKRPSWQRREPFLLLISPEEYDNFFTTLKKHHEEEVDFGSPDELLTDPNLMHIFSPRDNATEIIKEALEALMACRESFTLGPAAEKNHFIFVTDPAVLRPNQTVSAAQSPLLAQAEACLFALQHHLPLDQWLTQDSDNMEPK